MHTTRTVVLSCVTLVMTLVFAGAAHASTNLILNGDFTDNASGYTTFPFTDGDGSNPLNPTDWSGYGGIRGPGSDNYGSYPFGPAHFDLNNDSSMPVTTFAFVQNADELTQSFHVVAGQEYQLGYIAAARGDGTQDDQDEIIATITYNSNDSTLFTQNGQVSSNTFMENTDPETPAGGGYLGFDNNGEFTATSSGEVTLTFAVAQGNAPASVADYTADFTDVSVEAIGTIVPEPTSLGMLLIGSLALGGWLRFRARSRQA